MYILYADESGSTGTDYDNKEQPIFVLGGLLIEDKKWHKINKCFNEEKVKICSLLKENEIHASELFNSSKKSVFNKNDWKENLNILEKIVKLILSFDISFQYIVIDKKIFKKSINEEFGGAIKLDPYIFAFSILYKKIELYLNIKNNKGLIFLDDILTVPEQIYSIYPELSKNNKNIIENAMFIKYKETNFIQMADIFSFYINKFYSIKCDYKKYGIEKQKHCIDMYNMLKSKIILENCESILKD